MNPITEREKAVRRFKEQRNLRDALAASANAAPEQGKTSSVDAVAVDSPLIHIKEDASQTLCGISGRLPQGHTFFFAHEYAARRATCPQCNPNGPRPIGTPLSQLTSARFCEIAATWGYD